jgi:cytochrome c-type biogenesis protein CcmH
MLFWIIVSCATALLALLLLAPLVRKVPLAVDEHSHDVEVYRDQLKEVERDAADGLISQEQAGYARAEIGRRLIASADKVEGEKVPPKRRRHRLAQAFVILLFPVMGIGLYLYTGDPGLPAKPLQARLDHPGNDIGILIAKAENHLMKNPDDGAGWDLLAPIYLRNMRPEEAADAFRNAIRILGPSAARLGGLGESLVASNNGLVTSDAKSNFSEALKLDSSDARSEYYLAVAMEQEGRSLEALAAFKSLAATSRPDAPWQPIVARHIAMLENGTTPPAPSNGQAKSPANPKAPGNPTAADIAAAQGMNAGDRQQMILGMVQGLDEKLKSDPNNFEGWMRLVRSYAMLKDEAKASDALKRALSAFPAEGAQGQQLLAMAKELGISAEAAKQ